MAGRKGDTVIDTDEAPTKAMPEKIPTLKPAFKKDGTVTAANSSSISDGAAAMVLMRASTAENLGVKPLARIVAHSQHSQEPNWFTTAPVGALKNLFAKTGWKAEDVDLYEINEAFAVVTMAAMTDFKLPHDKVNVHGGATALGHLIGAWRPPDGHPGRRAAQDRRQARRGHAVHRRRRSRGDGHRDGLIPHLLSGAGFAPALKRMPLRLLPPRPQRRNDIRAVPCHTPRDTDNHARTTGRRDKPLPERLQIPTSRTGGTPCPSSNPASIRDRRTTPTTPAPCRRSWTT